MRKFNHWTPRYIKDRVLELYYHKCEPTHPWLTKDANKILDSYLDKEDVGVEFGSGRSTIWFANKTKFLTSIEHNNFWFNKTQNLINEKKINNVNYRLIHLREIGDKREPMYVKVIEEFDDESLDYALVDGKYRALCVLKLLSKIKKNGILIIDNVNCYLPCKSFSPDSRTKEQGPIDKDWVKVQGLLDKYKKIWTSSGVTDTAIYFKV